MKVIFEPKDFLTCGQYIIQNNSKVRPNSVYKIGYYVHATEGNIFLLISMSDGMANLFSSAEALCKRLNESEPGFRPASTDELRKITDIQGNRFEPNEVLK